MADEIYAESATNFLVFARQPAGQPQVLRKLRGYPAGSGGGQPGDLHILKSTPAIRWVGSDGNEYHAGGYEVGVDIQRTHGELWMTSVGEPRFCIIDPFPRVYTPFFNTFVNNISNAQVFSVYSDSARTQLLFTMGFNQTYVYMGHATTYYITVKEFHFGGQQWNTTQVIAAGSTLTASGTFFSPTFTETP